MDSTRRHTHSPPPAEEKRHVATARRVCVTELNLAQLRTVQKAMMRLLRTLPQKSGWNDHVNALWNLAYQEAERRDEKLAEKRDNGEVIFAVCSLRERSGHREFVRTPHRMM